MTREEAIYIITGLPIYRMEKEYDSKSDLMQTLEMAIEALEKQIPKKPLYNQGTKYKWIDTVRERGRYRNVEKYSYRDACPNCKKNVLESNYCEHCGQALNWED